VHNVFALDRALLDELRVQDEKRDFTGFGVLDRLVSGVVHGRFDSYPRLKASLRRTLLGLSGLHLFQRLYLAAENRSARSIGEKLAATLAAA
jgi:hypothetical protein